MKRFDDWVTRKYLEKFGPIPKHLGSFGNLIYDGVRIPIIKIWPEQSRIIIQARIGPGFARNFESSHFTLEGVDGKFVCQSSRESKPVFMTYGDTLQLTWSLAVIEVAPAEPSSIPLKGGVQW